MTPKLEEARALLARPSRVAVFSGAGLSAESGISTFRDTETDAYWQRFNPMELATPEGFAANPERVIDWYNWRRRTLATARPNPAHVSLAAQHGLVQITQNVDDLLERAGVPYEQVYHLHGTLSEDRCHAGCGYRETIELAEPPALRACVQCGAPMRPAVVWFGEALPGDVWQKAETLCRNIDCLLVVGTSATVYPAAGLIGIAHQQGTKVIVINPNASDASALADVELIGESGTVLPVLLEGLSLASV